MLSASRRGKFFWNKHRELRLDGPGGRPQRTRGRERERLARPAPGGHAWGSSRPSRGLGTYPNPMGDSATPKDFRGSRCPSTKCLLCSPVIAAHTPLLQEAAGTGSLPQPTSPLQKN